jgi:hypothetical protein
MYIWEKWYMDDDVGIGECFYDFEDEIDEDEIDEDEIEELP